MERPVRPAFNVKVHSVHLKSDIFAPIAVPNGILPMDLYNALLRENVVIESIRYGWLTTKGLYVTASAAAQLALEANLLDERVKELTVEDYQGSWRRRP